MATSTTIAGNVYLSRPDGKTADGTGGTDGTATFINLWGVAVDSAGNIYVSDYGDNRVRKIDPAGNVTTLAGNGQQGSADGSGGPQRDRELQQSRRSRHWARWRLVRRGREQQSHSQDRLRWQCHDRGRADRTERAPTA